MCINVPGLQLQCKSKHHVSAKERAKREGQQADLSCAASCAELWDFGNTFFLGMRWQQSNGKLMELVMFNKKVLENYGTTRKPLEHHGIQLRSLWAFHCHHQLHMYDAGHSRSSGRIGWTKFVAACLDQKFARHWGISHTVWPQHFAKDVKPENLRAMMQGQFGCLSITNQIVLHGQIHVWCCDDLDIQNHFWSFLILSSETPLKMRWIGAMRHPIWDRFGLEIDVVRLLEGTWMQRTSSCDPSFGCLDLTGIYRASSRSMS